MLAATTCVPTAQQVNAITNLTCALAQDGSTVVAIARPGAALPASAGAKVACDVSSQVGAAFIPPS